MSFLIGPHSIVYQKDLGARTEAIASRMTRFDPDASWSPVRD
jgi:hypothetical protein